MRLIALIDQSLVGGIHRESLVNILVNEQVHISNISHTEIIWSVGSMLNCSKNE